MKKNQVKKKWEYVVPECKVIKMEPSNLICASVTPDSRSSTEKDWDSFIHHGGGTIYIGSDNAPAQKANLWFDEDFEMNNP